MIRTVQSALPVAPGAQILVRDAVWRVLKVEPTSSSKAAWHVVGVSEIVRGHEAIFLEELEPHVEVLDPTRTRLVADPSPKHRAGRLFLEGALRDVPPDDASLCVGHRAAMDLLEYQLEPARLALDRPRRRILIADGVGLGKTLEAGILLSELVRRGRARRILVVTTKAMLAQFQREMWCRFTIPLVRLDSIGIARLRARIPVHLNAFQFFDRAIISVDTLKQPELRPHVEQATWDVVVIDEAHNVAERGSRSQRAALARALGLRADALILLSATPHDGRPRSFASLMTLLDPTAIADPDDYGPEDIRGLFVRRFRRDIDQELRRGGAFPDPEVKVLHVPASPSEETAFAHLAAFRETGLAGRRQGGMLFGTLLEKSLLSSPKACLQTIDARLRKLENGPECAALGDLRAAVAAIEPADVARFRKLVETLRAPGPLKWNPRGQAAKRDRLIIFTERLETLAFLHERLPEELGLDGQRQVAVLDGSSMSDVEQQKVVDDFGRDASPIRLLLATDVASEGLNLHYLCHRLIHFDIPWSLMKFQQRNGRIDRYGQEQQPLIAYLVTTSTHERVAADLRILEVLIAKEKQARDNIGDLATLARAYDADLEETQVAEAIEQGLAPNAFAQKLAGAEDALELLLGAAGPPVRPAAIRKEPPTLFGSTEDYVRAALEHLEVPHDTDEGTLVVTPPADLDRRLAKLPDEAIAEDEKLYLSAEPRRILDAMRLARSDESGWPRLSYLWPLHPLIGWVNDVARGLFDRHSAPVLTLDRGLPAGEQVVLVSGLLPNRRGQPLLHRWYAAVFQGRRLERVEPLAAVFARVDLRRDIPNRRPELDAKLSELLPTAIEAVRARVLADRSEHEALTRARLDEETRRLGELRKRRLEVAARIAGREAREAEQRSAEKTFKEHLAWVRDTMTTDEVPFLQVMGVLV